MNNLNYETFSNDEIPLRSEPAVQYAIDSKEPEKPVISLKLQEILEADNVLEVLDDVSSYEIALIDDIERDQKSMDHYLELYDRAIKMAKMIPEKTTKTFPFDGSSRVMLPYVMIAAIDFNARATPDLLEGGNIVDVHITGQHNGPDREQIEARASRISIAINYELNRGIRNWRDDQDRANLLLAIVGTVFKKYWYCPIESKIKCKIISPEHLIFDHGADCFSEVERKSHKYIISKNDALTAIRSGQFSDFDIDAYEDSEQIELIESHCLLDLDEDGFKEPYIVNIETRTQKLVSIVKRFDEYDISFNENNEILNIAGEEFFTQTIFMPDPSGSCMGLGWGILLGDLFETITTNTRQIIDAGTLQNVGGNSGFIRSGSSVGGRSRNRQAKGTVEMTLGRFTTIESYGSSPLQNDIVNFPFQGPSPVLMDMLERLKAETQRLTTAVYYTENVTNESPEVYLSRLQQSLKIPNSIMVRVYSGISKEYMRIFELHQRYMTDEMYRNITNVPTAMVSLDYDDERIEIMPTIDPTQGTEQERVAKAQFMYQQAVQMPQLYNLREAATRLMKALKIPDPELLMPEPQGPSPEEQQQQQYMQLLAENERMAAQAKSMQAQAQMMKARIEMQKLRSEIEKTISETLKNLSDVDKNERETLLKTINSKFDHYRGILQDEREIENERNQRMGESSGDSSLPGES